MNNQPQSVSEWIHSRYLYEESLFFFTIINFALYCIGSFTIGFQFEHFSVYQNAILNVLWFLCLSVAMCFPAFWYRLILGKNAYLFRAVRRIEEAIDSVDEEKRELAVALLNEHGKRILNVRERVALGFLFTVMLFDLLFARVWVEKGILTWQPEWVLSCINWVKSHTTMPPINQGWDIFYLYFGDYDKSDSLLKQEFGDEFQFIQHPVGQTLLFYHFIRTVLFIPIITASTMVLWLPLQFMGNSDKDPSNIHSIGGFIRACAWSIVMGFFLIIPTWGIVSDVTRFIDFIRTGSNFEVVFGFYLFITLAVRFLVGWFIFWKRIFIKLLGVINHE